MIEILTVLVIVAYLLVGGVVALMGYGLIAFVLFGTKRGRKRR